MPELLPSPVTNFGRYEVLESLGRGAMGVVYKARDPKIDRLVAIKTISFQGVTAEKAQAFRERFVIEAKAAGRLSHPGIVAIYDVGEDAETRTPYIVMEYVQGDSLERLLALSPGGLPVEQSLTIVKQVAEALDYAHSEGVVHRDIKPANIIVAPDGRVKIADFGVAKLESETSSGMTFGTPAYMSPEQVKGSDLDGRSDLFSLGVVLYTCLVGFRPFHGSGASTISFKVVNRDPVPASSFNPTLIPEIDHVIGRAMAKDVEARYQSGSEMALDVGDLLAGKRPRTSGPAEIKSQNFTFLEAIAPACESGIMRLGQPETATSSAVPPPPLKVLEPPRKRHRSILVACVALGGVLALLLGYRAFVTFSEPPTVTIAAPASLVAPPAPASVPAAVIAQPVSADVPPRNLTPPHDSRSAAIVPRETCSLNLEVEHDFKQAQLSLYVDDAPLTEEPLFGESRKQLGLFGGYKGQQSSELDIAPGTHVIRVHVRSADNSIDRIAEATAEFKAGTTKVVRLSIDNGRLDLKMYDPLPTVTSPRKRN